MKGEETTMAKSEKSKKIIFIILVVIFLILSVFGVDNFDKFFDEEYPWESGETVTTNMLNVRYFDVGQGDSSLVECEGKYMLIDAGENGHEQQLINYLNSVGVQKLDYIIVTHQHSDHIGGIPEVLEEFEADNIIMPRLTEAQTPTNSTYTAFLKAVQNSGAKVIASKVGASYTLGSATFETFGPVTNDAEDINNMSVVVKVTYGENTFLFTGDAETEEEKEVLDTGADLDCDVLHAGHHGSYSSSCKDFLNAVTPEICVISCGANNDYGHPHDAALKRIKKHTEEIYRTDICGSIVIQSDGQEIVVNYENM